MDVNYIFDTNEIEIIDDFGFPTYKNLSELEIIDANERELGVEEEYVIELSTGILHIFFYPEGRLSDYYLEQP